MNEDERQAAAIKVGISNYVGSASLAVLAGSVAVFTYVSQHYKVQSGFYILMTLTAGALVYAMFCGGRGAESTVRRVVNGTWSNQETPEFNRQALFTLIGVVLLLTSTVVGVTADRSGPAKAPAHAHSAPGYRVLLRRVQADERHLRRLQRQTKRLSRRVN